MLESIHLRHFQCKYNFLDGAHFFMKKNYRKTLVKNWPKKPFALNWNVINVQWAMMTWFWWKNTFHYNTFETKRSYLNEDYFAHIIKNKGFYLWRDAINSDYFPHFLPPQGAKFSSSLVLNKLRRRSWSSAFLALNKDAFFECFISFNSIGAISFDMVGQSKDLNDIELAQLHL